MALGLYRGLRFGLVQHPQGAPEVYIEGALRRSTALARDVHGPRAILNAVERLIGSAATERDKATRDLAIAQGQLPGLRSPPGRRICPCRVSGGTDGPAQPAGGRTVQHRPGGCRGVTASRGRARRAHQSPPGRPYPGRRPGADCPTPHGHGCRGDHHAHSPARAGRGRAPAGRRAGPSELLRRLHRSLPPRRNLQPRLSRHSRNPGRLPSSCACSRNSRGGVTGAACSPHPRGALPIAATPVGNGWPSPPCRGLWRRSQRRPGLPPQEESARDGERGCSACTGPLRLSSLLGRLRNIRRGGSLASRPAPSAALGAAPQP